MSGTPRSLAAFRWSCGQDAEAARVLGQGGGDPELGGEVGDGRGELRALGELVLIPPRAVEVLPEVLGHLGELGCRKCWSPASSPRRAAETAPSRRTGSASAGRQPSGSAAWKSCWVSLCQDQRRLRARSLSGRRGSGRTGRTVNRRMAFTYPTFTGDVRIRGDARRWAPSPSPSTVAVCRRTRPRRAPGSVGSPPRGPDAPVPGTAPCAPSLRRLLRHSCHGLHADTCGPSRPMGQMRQLRTLLSRAIWLISPPHADLWHPAPQGRLRRCPRDGRGTGARPTARAPDAPRS